LFKQEWWFPIMASYFKRRCKSFEKTCEWIKSWSWFIFFGKYKLSPLHRCILHCSETVCNQVVPVLLELGADIEANTTDGKTPLFFAAYRGFTQVTKKLISVQADINTPDKNGNIPLHFVSDVDCATALINGGGKVDMWNKQFNSPLHSAYAFHGDCALTKFIQSQFPEKFFTSKEFKWLHSSWNIKYP